jgi:hypothetical protein
MRYSPANTGSRFSKHLDIIILNHALKTDGRNRHQLRQIAKMAERMISDSRATGSPTNQKAPRNTRKRERIFAFLSPKGTVVKHFFRSTLKMPVDLV